MMIFVKSEPGKDPIIVEAWFAADPAEVFLAWTDPQLVMKWFGETPNSLHSAKLDLRKGGSWRFVMIANEEKSVGFEGHYLDIQPDQKLVFTWAHVVIYADGRREETPVSRIEVTFKVDGAGTHVHLVHSAISNEPSRRGIGGGWQASFTALHDMFGRDES